MNAVITEEDKKLLQQLKEGQAARLKKAKDNARKYKHALVDQHFTFDPKAGKNGKFQTRIKCTVCGDTSRLVYTSDLFQVKSCRKCTDKLQAKSKEQKAAERKRGLELLEMEKAGKIKV